MRLSPKRKSILQPTSPGFTLLELIIVIALIALVYTVALPNFGLKSSTDVAQRIGRLNADIKAAFDFAILSKRPCRLAFKLISGEYWLEVTEADHVTISDTKLLHELTKDEERDLEEQFESDFDDYVQESEKSFTDDKDEQVLTSSPVLKAKNKLRPIKWRKYSSLEWGDRSLGSSIGFKGIQAEHHEAEITVDAVGEDAMAYVYFFPQGYVEKAVFYIYYLLNENQFDLDQPPYTIVTKPYQGTGEVMTGNIRIDVHNWKEDEEKS